MEAKFSLMELGRAHKYPTDLDAYVKCLHERAMPYWNPVAEDVLLMFACRDDSILLSVP